MTKLPAHFEELTDLAWALVNDRLDAAGADRLEQLLAAEASHRRVYIELMDQFASLEWEHGEGGRRSGEWRVESAGKSNNASRGKPNEG
jgi:hypothetical protein